MYSAVPQIESVNVAPASASASNSLASPKIGHLGNERKLPVLFERLIVARTQSPLEQDIGRLEIAVDDAAGVRMRDGRGQLADQFGRQP